MANITFIIGNGFDLSLGFKTSYGDFYRYVEKNNLHPKNRIYRDIKNDPDTWAAFERTLGTYTQYIEGLSDRDKRKESISFHDDLADVTDDLAEYLATQERLIDSKPPRISFGKRDFLEGLPIGQKELVMPFTSDLTNFNYITLNFTKTLEKVLPGTNVPIVPQEIVIRNIHHVHGDLTEDMTIGVSDESQLSSALVGSEKDDLIKPRSIANMYDGRIELLRRIINESSVIVLFGTSIGETDRYIWELIIDWLEINTGRYIIVHKHDPNYTETTGRIPRRKRLFISNVQNKLLENANLDHLDEDQKAALRGRIFVIHNTKKLFTQLTN